MNENNNLRTITFKELWNIFISRIVVIVLVGAIVLVCGLIIGKITYKPKYESTATLYIIRENENVTTSSGEAYNEFTLALKVANDCTYLLKSRTVAEQVIDDLRLDMTYGELRGMVSVTNPTNTRILEVTVTADTPETAKLIVDRLCEVGRQHIAQAMGFEQVNLYEYGALENMPANSVNKMIYLVVAVAAAAVVYLVFVVAFLLDDRIRSLEDIERMMGLSILGEIPNFNSGGRRYGYGKYGKGYGYGSVQRSTKSGAKAVSNDKEKRS